MPLQYVPGRSRAWGKKYRWDTGRIFSPWFKEAYDGRTCKREHYPKMARHFTRSAILCMRTSRASRLTEQPYFLADTSRQNYHLYVLSFLRQTRQRLGWRIACTIIPKVFGWQSSHIDLHATARPSVNISVAIFVDRLFASPHALSLLHNCRRQEELSKTVLKQNEALLDNTQELRKYAALKVDHEAEVRQHQKVAKCLSEAEISIKRLDIKLDVSCCC